jgi:hypothetical protein
MTPQILPLRKIEIIAMAMAMPLNRKPTNVSIFLHIAWANIWMVVVM